MIFPAHTEAPLRLCVMEKYPSVGRAILLLSGLRRSGNRTMKDKAVSARSAHQLHLSFISPWSLGQTQDSTGCLWSPLRTISLTGRIADHRMRPERFHIWFIILDVRHVVLVLDFLTIQNISKYLITLHDGQYWHLMCCILLFLDSQKSAAQQGANKYSANVKTRWLMG